MRRYYSKLAIIICLGLIWFLFLYKHQNIEPFWDLVPYNLHWDIFSCYTEDCLKKKSYDCYKYCAKLDELGGKQNCMMRCEDYTDQKYEQIRLQDRLWNFRLGNLKKYSLINSRDYVLKRESEKK